MIVYPVLVIRYKTNPGSGYNSIFPPIPGKTLPNPVIFFYLGIVLWTRVTRVISFWTRFLGIVGGYPESKTIPRTFPITNKIPMLPPTAPNKCPMNIGSIL